MTVAEERDRLAPAAEEARWRARQLERQLAESQAAADAAQTVRGKACLCQVSIPPAATLGYRPCSLTPVNGTPYLSHQSWPFLGCESNASHSLSVVCTAATPCV